MHVHVNRYEQPAFLKADRKLTSYANFWFRLGIAAMLVPAVVGLTLLFWGLVHSLWCSLVAVGLMFVGLFVADRWCKPRWQRGHQHISHAIMVVHKIEIRKIWEKA